MFDFLRSYVFANFGYKVVSLALALGLWLALARDPAAVVGVSVPIEFHNIPSNLEISSVSIPEAQVRVRGPERLIHELRPQEVHVEVDLSGVNPGERTFDLTAQQVRQPRDLEVAQIIPSQVRLSFDTAAIRQVEVRPRVIGTFAGGYRIAPVLADPATLSISGPKQRVEAVEAATTDPVDATGNMGKSTFVTNAFVPDPLVQIVHPMPVRVTVIMEKTEAEPAAPGTKPSE
jgi:YbbR domain-containing protein